MNVFCLAGVHQQPEQSNYLAEGQTLACKFSQRHNRLPFHFGRYGLFLVGEDQQQTNQPNDLQAGG